MGKSNLKVLFINTFFVLFIAGTASIHRLQLDLIEIESTLKNISSTNPLIPGVLTLILSSFVLAKFFFSYISLAAHVTAFYPIFNQHLSDLLLPTIILQTFQNVLFNLAELSMGYFTCYYYLTTAQTACSIFYVKMILKAALGAAILDLYWNYYTHLRAPVLKIITTREFLKQITRRPRSVTRESENSSVAST